MNINKINLRKLETTILVDVLSKNIFEPLTKSEKKQLRSEIISSIEEAVFLKALNSLLIAFTFDKESMFVTIKQKGVFRYSKYVSKRCIVANLIQKLIAYDKHLSLFSDGEKKYLTSVLNLSSQNIFFRDVDKKIIAEINLFEKKYRGKSMIKTLLAYTDFLFFSDYIRSPVNDTRSILCRSKEEIASAASYLIYRICNKGEKHQRIGVIADEYIKSKSLETIILDCCWMSDFKEFEILIDYYDYRCILEKSTLKILPPSLDFEKSMRLGYIKSQIQIFNDLRNLNNLEFIKNRASLEDLVDKLVESNHFSIFRLVHDNNYTRYKLEIPEHIFETMSGNFFGPDFLFKEEAIYLAQIFKEQLLNIKDLKEIKIKGDLSIMDVIKIKRSIDLLYLIFFKELYNIEKVEKYLIYRSLIPVFTEDNFYNLIEKLTSVENIDSYLDMMCWENESDVFFDVQYRPIIFLDKHFVIPLSIFAKSNSIRNLYASEYKQNNKTLFSDGHKDVLVDRLYTYFEKASIKVYKQLPVPKTDIDLFAVYDNILFIFECKHTLHPVSVYDQRTTFDYIKKAEKQLDVIVKLYSEGKLIKMLEEKCKISLTNIEIIVPVIVLSNRIFNGNIFKYPVRNINEIENILLRGTMTTKDGVFWIWEKDTLQVSDLVEYFSKESKIVKFLFESLSATTISYNTPNGTIEYETFNLNIKESGKKMKKFTSKMRIVKNISLR